MGSSWLLDLPDDEDIVAAADAKSFGSIVVSPCPWDPRDCASSFYP